MRKMNSIINVEEKKIVTWFLFLFYTIVFFYDFFYYYLYPKFLVHKEVGFPHNFGYWIYLFMFLLIFLVVYLYRINKQRLVKYVYFVSYSILTLIFDLLVYHDNVTEYTSGNAVEVFLILFSPIFISKPFFWVVSLGLTSKYILIGLSLHAFNVVFPIVLTLLLSMMAYLLLVRFQGYVTAVKKSYDVQLEGIVKGVIATLELKDPYTRGHSERVASYAVVLANEVGVFSAEEMKSFNYACLLHDIGKVNIPDQILTKPGKLSLEEFDIIKTHPAVGEKAVRDVEGIKGSLSVIRSHHERWDGKGYPDKLKGEKIPLPARIVSIADAFDAMTSSRSYRGALPVEEAYKRIIEGQGTQFDPQLVEVFKNVYSSWLEIHEGHNR